MLTRLYIKNVAVIKEATIALAPGFNVLTGETGAGKTVLISSIDAVLGERTSRDIIRIGEDKAVVTAMFEDISEKASEILRSLGYEDEDGTVLISREITSAGKNICRIGGVPATTAILREISSCLLQIHGQRDTSQLLSADKHLELIDGLAETAPLLVEYSAEYNKLRELRHERNALDIDESEKARRMDMLRYQLDEIEAAELEDEAEEEELTARRRMVQGSERIRQGLAQAYAALQGDNDREGINSLAAELTEGIGEAAGFVESLAAMSERIDEIAIELEEFAADIRASLDEFDFDPRELDEIERRLDVIYKLKRKYGSSIAEILEHYRNTAEELEGISLSEKRIEAVKKQIAAAEKDVIAKAGIISKKRLEAADIMVSQVESELAFLDMPGVKLSVRHREHQPRDNGIDEMELYIVTNAGDEPKPLSKIASGGELARIMLAIKNVLAGRDDIATLIFDEVDTGVSGRAAGKIGAKLRQVANARQVICVTHLAQVAAYADRHFLIAKQEKDGSTFTQVGELSHEDAVHELARITSGDLITPAALQSAGELWDRAHKK